ncbi:unnamed protein product [Arabis nemorensis]|uniref:DUF1985 domain-containing protein n=1 Tax=Arabis nemorensis TaxID=586526 RepID=A0A565AUD0_9BRAS|nr:unnamed protein product [Arabis nemorensis]
MVSLFPTFNRRSNFLSLTLSSRSGSSSLSFEEERYGNRLLHFDFNFDFPQRFWLLMIMSDMEFTLRLYKKEHEPPPNKSIGYYAGDTKLFQALARDGVLKRDELNELYDSKLDLETPEVEVTDEIKAFRELLGVDLEMGPCLNDLVAACGACQSWSRVDRMRLGYLCIYAGYIEGQRDSTPTPTNVKSFVMKNTMVEMLPLWDGDVQDANVENILNVAFDKGWKWQNSHWPVVGVKFYKCVKEESDNEYNKRSWYEKSETVSFHTDGQSRKRSRSVEEDSVSMIRKLQSHIDDCVMDLSTKIDDGENDDDQNNMHHGIFYVGISTKSKSKTLANKRISERIHSKFVNVEHGEVQSQSVNGDEPSVMIIGRVEPRPNYVSPFLGHKYVKFIIPKGKRYDPFEPANKQKMKLCNHKLNCDAHGWCNMSTEYSKHPKYFRSNKNCFVDTILFTMWTGKYKDFVDFPTNEDGFGKLLPPAALD